MPRSEHDQISDTPRLRVTNYADSEADHEVSAAPRQVRVLRVLGNGRAATARLVEAVMPDGRTQCCVEKVFAAGWLTRAIYRISFQAPFAYRSNRDAVLACYYRRRVAAALFAASGLPVKVAEPLYVRFDAQSRAWVLAAQWIDGRGIRPQAPDRYRTRRMLAQWGSRARVEPASALTTENRHEQGEPAEICELIGLMSKLEQLLTACGLVGSGWQVSPRAMVSTANLLREPDHYTVIDLESGIPAVLVPKYVIAGAIRGELPPFDDLDANRLRGWLDQNRQTLGRQLNSKSLATLHEDVEHLIESSRRWKSSELALLRRPWRLLQRDGLKCYQDECIRRWQQEGIIDGPTEQALHERPGKARLIWYAGLLPGLIGRVASRLIGDRSYRERWIRCLHDREFRRDQVNRRIHEQQTAWIEVRRLSPAAKLTPLTFLLHRLLATLAPVRLHRLMSDREYRRSCLQLVVLLLFSSRYQAWFGQHRIESAIDSWVRAKRISTREARQLQQQLSGTEVRAYLRGLGAHLALKTLLPVLAPVKYGGVAAFIASGNAWFLLPLVFMPAARTIVTAASWWSTRHQRIPHAEAFLAGVLPVVGSVAFPLQLYAARSELSTFLIRDAASKLGRRVPIYGGPNSRTEIALIRASDRLVELLDVVSTVSRKLYGFTRSSPPESETATIRVSFRTRVGHWLDQLALRRIAQHEQLPSQRHEDARGGTDVRRPRAA